MQVNNSDCFICDENGIRKIYSAENLSKAVYDTLKYQEDCVKKATDRANKTREEVEAEIKNEWREENERIKEKLRFSVASLYSQKEIDAYNAFDEEHMKCRQTKATGGMAPYVIQNFHGIGCCTRVYCQVCGASKDITDDSIW